VIFAGEAERAGLLVNAIKAGTCVDALPFAPLDGNAHWGRYAFQGWEARKLGNSSEGAAGTSFRFPLS